MVIRLRFFASLRERLGAAESLWRGPDGETVGGVLDALKRSHPELADVESSLAFAVNEEYVGRHHELKDDDELALIPPVSGGTSEDSGAAKILCKTTFEPLAVAELVDFVGDPAAGAVVTFVGTTRNTNEGRRVVRLEYEAYEGMAEKEMEKIVREALSRWRLEKAAVAHRLGRVDIGQASVAIAVSSGHRHDAFEACRFIIDRLKEVVPIWKKELYEGGELWIGSQSGERGTWRRAANEAGET